MSQTTTEVLEMEQDVSPAEAEKSQSARPVALPGAGPAHTSARPASLPGAGPASEDDEPSAKRVPVAESIRYRKRAQQAEQQLRELQSQHQRLRDQLDLARRTIDAVERRRKIDQMLVESDAVDLEAARLLTELAVEQMDEPDVAAAVEELRQRKPYLFRRRGGGGATLSPRPRPGNGGGTLDDAAEQASQSGDRRDLLRYLRLRRRTANHQA
ncbi:MAG: hypothetical protein WC058_03295 [Phycisphaeraceae bacterium]